MFDCKEIMLKIVYVCHISTLFCVFNHFNLILTVLNTAYMLL